MNVVELKYYMHKGLRQQLTITKDGACNNDMSFVLGFDGPERYGKSTLCAQAALELDPSIRFDLDRVAFTIPQFMEACEKARKLGKGKVVVLDEAGNIFDTDQSRTYYARKIKKILMMTGKYNIIYLMCVPSIFDLTPYVRIHRLNWFVRLKIQTYQNKKSQEWKFRKGLYEVYNRTRKNKLLELSKYKYDYSQVKPLFYGDFYNAATPEDIYGKGYQEKKDKAIQELYGDDEVLNYKHSILLKLNKQLGKPISNQLIADACDFKVEYLRSIYKKYESEGHKITKLRQPKNINT